MKILFVGVLDVNWSTNVEMKKSLQILGHQVDSFNYRTEESEHISIWQRNVFFGTFLNKLFSYLRRFDALPATLRNLYYRILGRTQMNQKLLEKARSRDYDMVLFLKTDTVSPQTIARISKKTKTWYYFMDPMFVVKTINACEFARNSTFASATFSDIHELFRDHNPDSFWMTQGIDSAIFKSDASVEKSIDVFFAGSKTNERKQRISYMRDSGLNVTCHGVGWENPPVYQEDLVHCYRRSRIVLNLCREGRGFSVRVFQVMGAGAFLLSEHCPDLEQVFDQKKHLDWAVNVEELADKALHYLAQPEERESIAAVGCAFVHREKNWERLMANLIKQFERNKP